MRLRESKELEQLVNLEPNPKLRSWDPRVRVLPNVLGKGANSTPQIIPQLHCGCLFHGGPWSPWRCKTFIGPHNLSGFTSYCGSSYHFSSGVLRVDTAVFPLICLLWTASLSPPANTTGRTPDALCQGTPKI